MAITDTFPAMVAEILVNGTVLQEYDDDDDNSGSGSTVKYIEAVSGAEFAIRYKIDEEPDYDVRVDFSLDGRRASGEIVQLDRFYGGSVENVVAGVSSNKDGRWLQSNFTFSDLKIVDSTGRTMADQLMKDLKGMGVITVDFHYVLNVRPSNTSTLYGMETAGLGDVPEKALKGRALSHQATLRPPIPTQAVSIASSDYLDPREKPFASISFKYRSRDALKSLLVIPRSPSPVPLEDRDIESLNPEEMRELLQRQREAAAQTVKQERGIKRERSRERSSTVGALSGDADDVAYVSTKRTRLPVMLNEDGIETIDLT